MALKFIDRRMFGFILYIWHNLAGFNHKVSANITVNASHEDIVRQQFSRYILLKQLIFKKQIEMIYIL